MGMDPRLLKSGRNALARNVASPAVDYFFQTLFNSMLDAPAVWRGANHKFIYREPVFCKTNSGTILLFISAGTNATVDYSRINVGVLRSTDNGNNFSGMNFLPISGVVSGTTSPQITNTCPVVDTVTGTIWLLWSQYSAVIPQINVGFNPKTYAIYSIDDGLTWSTGGPAFSGTSDITTQVNPSGYPWFNLGPCAGITKQYAPNAGRMVITGNYRPEITGASVLSYSMSVYNDDHNPVPSITGWKAGGKLTQNDNNSNSNEGTVIEILGGANQGRLYNHCRRVGQNIVRGITTSDDGAITWSDISLDSITGASCAGSLINAGSYVLLAHPHDLITLVGSPARKRLSVRYSTDNAVTFASGKPVNYLWNAYSTMIYTNNQYVLIAYEKGDNGDADNNNGENWSQYISMAKFSLAWLTDTQNPPYVEYHFNEFPSGTLAQTGVRGINTLQDYGPYGFRAQITPMGGSDVPTYTDGRLGYSALRLGTSGTTNSIILAESGTHFYHPGTGSFTLETFARFPAITNTGIFIGSDRMDDNTNVWRLRTTTTGTLVAECKQSIFVSAAFTGSYNIADGNWYYICMRRNRGSDPKTLELIVKNATDGTLLQNVSGADTSTSLSTDSDCPPICLAQNFNGTNRLAVDIDIFKYTQGYVSDANLLSHTYDKGGRIIPTYPDDITTTFANQIPPRQTCLWIPGYRKFNQSYDLFYSRMHPTGYSSITSGMPIHYIRDLSSSGYRFKSTVNTQGPIFAYHTGVGWNWSMRGADNSVHQGLIGINTISGFDFIHQTFKFTISFCCFFATPPSGEFTGYQTILDNTDFGQGNGFLMFRDGSPGATSGYLFFQLKDSGLNVNQQLSAGKIPNNVWYHVFLSATGAGGTLWYGINPITSINPIINDSFWLPTGLGYRTAHSQLSIGARSVTAGAAMHGNIVDLVIQPTGYISTTNISGISNILSSFTRNWTGHTY